MKRQSMWTIDLNVKNNLVSGFGCRRQDVTVNQVKEALRAGIQHIQYTANKQDWHCIIYAVVSDTNPFTHEHVTAHAHVVVYGTPAYTIAKELKRYWTKHGYANSVPCKLTKCTTDGKISYMWAQAKHTFFRLINYRTEHASELFQCNEDEAKYFIKGNGRKRNILLAWLGYKAERENSSTKFKTILDKQRAFDTAFLRYLHVN